MTSIYCISNAGNDDECRMQVFVALVPPSWTAVTEGVTSLSASEAAGDRFVPLASINRLTTYTSHPSAIHLTSEAMVEIKQAHLPSEFGQEPKEPSNSKSYSEDLPPELRASTSRLNFTPSYVVVGVYRLFTDKSLYIPAWKKCQHGVVRGVSVGLVWVSFLQYGTHLGLTSNQTRIYYVRFRLF